ncbi:helix-turn-helix domain-containing protein [Flavobacterium quisquiliarum]|jgi:transcriptional regulator with XRE-family HTH domain|uniref:Helix-turn-helix domain-containing protein n=1 Tax=Flavobacterium quisquiliarum TaxID=1834436 RepID=A0ABV8W514_9FLAO|nr:helix-turn-helix transcriptional regulator [Flavobacterium quisquiliarum]MBW1657276.1 helix-turn-helix domain-containing protein [Flavobacterium quisquiliarum]NWL02023.1 hypothetical protein [Flavobacterium collinsii]
MPVGFQIKRLREENSLSQSRLADELGITQSELSKIENGRSKKIDIYFMLKVCNYFNKKLDFFVNKRMERENEDNFDIETSSEIIIYELEKIIQEFQKKDNV